MSETPLKSNQEIYDGLSESAKNLFNKHPTKECPDCQSNGYTSVYTMAAINEDVIALLDEKFFIYQGCSFGYGEVYAFKCRKCEKQFK